LRGRNIHQHQAMDAIALSTRWAGSPPRADALRRILEEVSVVAIHEGVLHWDFEELKKFLPSRGVAALSLFSPLPRSVRPGDPQPFRMGSLHPEERRDALEQGMRALRAADSLEVPFVVVPPAPLDEPSPEKVEPLLQSGGSERLWEALRTSCSARAARHLDSYLSTLARLLDQAARYARRLGIVIGGLPSELPDLAEAQKCLLEFEGAPLDLWVDLLRDARYRLSGGAGAERLRGDLRPQVAGLTVQDGDREAAHLPLGSGEVELERWEELRGAGALVETAPAERSSQGGPAEPAAGLKEPARAARTWVIDLSPLVAEEDLLETRNRLKTFLSGPEASLFDPLGFRVSPPRG